MPAFIYDLPRLLDLARTEQRLGATEAPSLELLAAPEGNPRSIGVLSGSFNPPTRGHAALVEGALREDIEAVLLLLPLRAVDKESVTRASAIDRALVLLEWARGYRSVGVGLVNRGLLVEQAALVAARYPECRLAFLVGHDKIVQVFDPRYYQDRDSALRALFERAAFHVAPRQGQSEAALRALLAREENRPFAAQVAALAVAADVDLLSSTAVRQAIARGASWEHLVPPEAAHFIRETRPYAPPSRLSDGDEIDAYSIRQALIAAAADGRLVACRDDFRGCYRVACADNEEGRRLRAWIAGAT